MSKLTFSSNNEEIYLYLDFALCSLWKSLQPSELCAEQLRSPISDVLVISWTCNSFCQLASPRTFNSLSHILLKTKVIELDSEVLRLPTTNLGLGHHKFGSSWLGSEP